MLTYYFKLIYVDMTAATVMLLFQVLQLILIVTISIKLARQLNSDAVASNFLIQSYLSTIVVFAGLFFLIFALTGRESFQLYVYIDIRLTH